VTFAAKALTVESLRYIGGFGRMSWIEGEPWGKATIGPLAPIAAGIIEHMNNEYADALVSDCLAFSTTTKVTSATITLMASYGFEMSAQTESGPGDHENRTRCRAKKCVDPIHLFELNIPLTSDPERPGKRPHLKMAPLDS
jgi:hypothetical protein